MSLSVKLDVRAPAVKASSPGKGRILYRERIRTTRVLYCYHARKNGHGIEQESEVIQRFVGDGKTKVVSASQPNHHHTWHAVPRCLVPIARCTITG